MVANINSMAYTGRMPWHQQGTKVEGVAMTAEQAINAGRLNWEVKKTPALFSDGYGKMRTAEDHFITYRTDTGVALGRVGNQYTILQNSNSFSFFDAVVGLKEAIYHTVGALGKGEKIWLLAKLPGEIRTLGDDISEKYLLMTNSHDGTSAVQVMFTPIRVVCQNTLNVAVKRGTNKFSIRHTTNMGQSVKQVQESLGIINQRFEIFGEASKQLAMTQLTKGAFKDYLKKAEIIPNKDEDSTRAKNIMEDVSRIFETGKGADLPSAKGTVWGAFNAVAEWVDYYRGSDQLEKKADSLLFGSGAKIKQRAFDQALVLAKY